MSFADEPHLPSELGGNPMMVVRPARPEERGKYVMTIEEEEFWRQNCGGFEGGPHDQYGPDQHYYGQPRDQYRDPRKEFSGRKQGGRGDGRWRRENERDPNQRRGGLSRREARDFRRNEGARGFQTPRDSGTRSDEETRQNIERNRGSSTMRSTHGRPSTPYPRG
mmetsp:Transcript_41454/g.81773  ORF Transcript_41454/g.81773 Transcript_41454/m.81773 type:complete len:165 (+) Transcript_41454:179-673(+)